MAWLAKMTVSQGGKAPDVVVEAGDGLTGTDAIQLQIDATNMSKGACLLAIDELKRRIHEGAWPIY